MPKTKIKPKLCFVCPPRQEDVFREYGECDTSCILPDAHWGKHAFKLPNGQHVAWEDDQTCDCCKPEDDEHCYYMEEISPEELEKLAQNVFKPST